MHVHLKESPGSRCTYTCSILRPSHFAILKPGSRRGTGRMHARETFPNPLIPRDLAEYWARRKFEQRERDWT